MPGDFGFQVISAHHLLHGQLCIVPLDDCSSLLYWLIQTDKLAVFIAFLIEILQEMIIFAVAIFEF